MLAVEAEILEQQQRYSAGTLHRHRTVIICSNIDDLAASHGVYGRSAAHVAVDEVHFLIVLALLLSIFDRLGSGVQQVCRAVLLDLGDTGNLGDIQQVASHGGVIDIRRNSQRLRDGVSQKSSQAGRVLRQFGACHLGVHLLVDLISAALETEQHAAAAYNCSKIVRVISCDVQFAKNDSLTIVLLRSYVGELEDLLLVMNDVLLKSDLGALICIDGDLSGC